MNIDQNTRLLIISPHPDDEAISCGGLIMKAVELKAKVLLVYLCVGSSRQLVTKHTSKNVRLKEIRAVEKLIKSKTKILYKGRPFTRLDTLPQKDIIEKIEDIVEKFKPDVIVIPPSTSYNQDHRAGYEACVTALRPNPQSTRHLVPHVLECYDPYFWGSQTMKAPNYFVNLSDGTGKKTLMDLKIELYKCHETQVRQDPHPRSVENLTRLAHIFGREIGVLHAEAYHVLRTII